MVVSTLGRRNSRRIECMCVRVRVCVCKPEKENISADGHLDSVRNNTEKRREMVPRMQRISKQISVQHFIRILCWFALRFPSPLLPFIQFCLSAAFLRFLSPVKSLEASRRGRERRLVTFPSRPLFLSYTHAVLRPHGHIHARESTVEARTQVHRIFSLFTPATTLPFPVQRVRRVSRCILMKKFVTSLRHPAAASAKRRRRKREGGGGTSFSTCVPDCAYPLLSFSHDSCVRNKRTHRARGRLVVSRARVFQNKFQPDGGEVSLAPHLLRSIESRYRSSD